MKGNRPSSLPIAQYCARAPELSSGIVGRAAVMGTAFHGLASGDNKEAINALTADELEKVLSWKKPADVEALGRTLKYTDAHKEYQVGLLESGAACAPDNPEAMTAGTVDLWWEPEEVDGMRVLYLGDIKKSEWTSEPTSLQLMAYGFGLADWTEATHMCAGIWAATEGTWTWGPMIDLMSPEALALFAKVKWAAMNVGGDYVTGTHCSGCYGRGRCPAWLLPPELAETSLAPLIADTGKDLTSEKAADLLFQCKRVTDMADKVIDILKAWAADNGGIVKDGKVWGPVQMPGRKGLDKKALEKDHPGLLEKYEKVGAGYEKYDWKKQRGPA